jgi:plastocyanin
MVKLRFSVRSMVVPAFLLILVAALGTGLASRAATAQNLPAAHPAHLHIGACDAPGDVVYPLTSVGFDYAVDGAPMAGSAIGAASAVPVESSQTTVQASLADIAAGGHALVVHESADAIQNYIACGDVGGTMMGQSDLAFGLAPLNDSGFGGVAWLHDNGDGTTMVTIFLTGGSPGLAESGGGAAAMGNQVGVSIENFAFSPQTIEIAVGDTVTWTNNDSTSHTASQSPSGSGFQSGTLAPGASFSQTFDTPGTYDYFCEFHANMTGAVVVS